MNKGMGRAQQIRGHKRRQKVLNMRKRRNPNAVKSEVGQIYWNHLVNDESERLKQLENITSSKIEGAQVVNVTQKVHRRKSG